MIKLIEMQLLKGNNVHLLLVELMKTLTFVWRNIYNVTRVWPVLQVFHFWAGLGLRGVCCIEAVMVHFLPA